MLIELFRASGCIPCCASIHASYTSGVVLREPEILVHHLVVFLLILEPYLQLCTLLYWATRLLANSIQPAVLFLGVLNDLFLKQGCRRRLIARSCDCATIKIAPCIGEKDEPGTSASVESFPFAKECRVCVHCLTFSLMLSLAFNRLFSTFPRRIIGASHSCNPDTPSDRDAAAFRNI